MIKTYQNGNYKVIMFDDGTKVRQCPDNEDFTPTFSENTDAIRVRGISSCSAIVISTGRLCWIVGSPEGALQYGAAFSDSRCGA